MFKQSFFIALITGIMSCQWLATTASYAGNDESNSQNSHSSPHSSKETSLDSSQLYLQILHENALNAHPPLFLITMDALKPIADQMNYAPSQVALGRLLHWENLDTENAEKYYQRAADEHGFAPGMFRFAYFLAMKGQVVKAEEYLKKAASLNHLRSKTALADMYILEGRFKEAEVLYREVANQPNDSEDSAIEAQIKLGIFLENLGRLKGAEKYLRKAADENQHKGAYYFLKEFLTLHDRPEEAKLYESDWWANNWGEDLTVRLIKPAFFKNLKAHTSTWWFAKLRLAMIFKNWGKNKVSDRYLNRAYNSKISRPFLEVFLKRQEKEQDMLPSYKYSIDINKTLKLTSKL